MSLNYRDTILEELKEWLYSVTDEEIVEFIKCLHQSKNIIGFGAGRMGLGLKAFIMRLNHLGKKAYYYTDTNIPPVGENDLYIFASGSGKTETTVTLAQIAKKKGCKIASMVGDKTSPLAKLSDITINFKSCNGGLNSRDNPIKINSIQIMSTLNEQGIYLLGDLISLKYCELMGVESAQLKENHNNVE